MTEPAIGADVAERFDHVLVDEYQDTNRLQASILLALKPNGKGVLVGNLRSEILVVQSAQNWHRQRATDSLDRTRNRRVLVQR
jgi:superfamily I DNA/RNA helicase